jgi:2-keto-4-pentenoate hydratase/2-oxohepta-3-ene-1,7-dioic acid hydratase in catechol pathway
MIWSVAEQIAYLSTYFELAPCDVIFSCTPGGVGAVTRGQSMIGAVEGLGEIRLRVVQGLPASPCLFCEIGRYCVTARSSGSR